MDEITDRILSLESEIALLPKGYISRKTIGGKVKLYHQWSEGGKKKSKYIDVDNAELLKMNIDKRRKLQQELKGLKSSLPVNKNTMKRANSKKEAEFITDIYTGERLETFVNTVKKYKARACICELNKYLFNTDVEKVFILYGLRRTGKTTLIRQTIAGMDRGSFSKTAFVQIRTGNTLADVNHDMKLLQKMGFTYVFLDEVTFMEDFIEGAALFSDIYASSSMKIVLSGTDSLGFLFSEDEQLYDRCILLHTTWIPYREFEDVLGVHGIDEYIRYGGTMSLGGVNYNENSTFASAESTDEYVDSAISRNIQHSLKCYQDAGHFRSLQSLYEKNELTGAINRIVEDINHRFTLEVLTRTFKSHNLGISARNLRRDRSNPTDILDRVDTAAITSRLKEILEIRNIDEQSVEITDEHRIEIREYLRLLDLIVDIPIERIPVTDEKYYQTVISQPGMRYCQTVALIEQLLLDSRFQCISAVERAQITERILNEIRGRMMEEIILLETKMARPKLKVFKLQFAIGEFDMVVADPANTTCEIYEIKHSTETAEEQYRHISDVNKCYDTEFRYGRITRKCILYRGKNQTLGDIEYINVEDYLKDL